ncbi:MAG: SRPBCC domain-containing protein [Steroidobacteraceae bacterium]
MKTTPLFHGMFTLTRSWAAAPAGVFSAWSDPDIKCQWFTGPPGDWTVIRREVDFRPGGREVHEGKFKSSGMTTLFEARFHVIEKNERLVFAYDLHLSAGMAPSSCISPPSRKCC